MNMNMSFIEYLPMAQEYKPLAVSLGGPYLLVTQSQPRVGAQAGWARQQRQPRARVEHVGTRAAQAGH